MYRKLKRIILIGGEKFITEAVAVASALLFFVLAILLLSIYVVDFLRF